MRFSTTVGTDETPLTSVRRWKIPELSTPSSQTSIPVWERGQTANNYAKKRDDLQTTKTSEIHASSLKSTPPEIARPRSEVRITCPGFQPSPDKNQRDDRLFRGIRRNPLSQRLVGLLMALCIAVGLLGCIMDRLSGELDKIEWELEKRNEMMSAGEQLDASLVSHPFKNPSERRARRLAATKVESISGRLSERHDKLGFWNDIKLRFGTVSRLIEFLNRREDYGTTAALVRTVYKFSETSILPAVTSTNHFTSAASTSAYGANSRSSASSPSKHGPFQNGREGTVISLKAQTFKDVATPVVQTPTSVLQIPKSAWTGSIFSRTVSGNPTSYNLFSSNVGVTNAPQRSTDGTVPSLTRKKDAPCNDSVQTNLSHSRENPLPFPIEGIDQHQLENWSVQENFQSNSSDTFEGFVLWELPRGRSLCRIFGAAKQRDGTLFLPNWMRKHEDILTTHCGIKNGMYVFETHSKAQLQRDHSSGKTLFDETFADQDLFSLHTPRHHMPHFLSDIIPPLVATEVILGSGREALPFKCVSRTGRSNSPFSPNFMYDVNPILFLDLETVSKPPTNWVPSLARFFAHPKIGFHMVPDITSDHSSELRGRDRPLFFRSIMLTNINPYEPYGLFGADGKNRVFTVNGISREPTWTSKGMLKRPCEVSVTVLTRKGHRALLELDELQKVINARFTEQGLDLNFKVVDFTDSCFEDQVRIMQRTNVLIASHGAGNTNIVFLKPGGTVIEVFPFSYKAGPFDGFAKIFGIEYKTAMSAPQTSVFKGCLRRKEKNSAIMKEVFDKWDKAVEEDKFTPWIHRLEFEKEFGEPGKSEGMTTRICARKQQLKFNIHAVAQMALDSGLGQCHFAQMLNQEKSKPYKP
ncbi:unnamed protein product [Agarophyton chilense]